MSLQPNFMDRMALTMKAVHVQCLDESQSRIKGTVASGFIVESNGRLYLHTCWHVVTGFDMYDVKVSGVLPNRKYLELSFQGFDNSIPNIQKIGGHQSLVLPLYDDNNVPLWIQNKQDVPHPDLNAINLKVPSWHDMVKISLPSEISVSDMQIIKERDILVNMAMIGEPIFVVGFPYGYSALGLGQPTAIVLVRFVAANHVIDRKSGALLDGPGAPGMSGGPVFVERDGKLLLIGIYTGLLYPDHLIMKNEKYTALGTMNYLFMWWKSDNV